MEPSLRLEASTSPTRVTIRVIGEVDAATAALLSDALRVAMADDPAEIELDCTEMTFLDSSGIRALVEASDRARDAASTAISITNVSPGPQRILEICGLGDLLTR